MVKFTDLYKQITLATLALSSAAPEVSDSPAGAKYVATFDDEVSGSVQFSTNSDGQINVDVDLSGLPTSGGPFLYHIHENPVPSNGNCTAVGGHLNPYNGSDTATSAASLEVGDLSGKHGKINGTSIDTSYVDPYLSLNTDDPAYFGNLSVVVHYANKTIIACTNITEEDSSNSSTTSAAASSSASVSTASDNAGAAAGASGALVVIAAGLGLLL